MNFFYQPPVDGFVSPQFTPVCDADCTLSTCTFSTCTTMWKKLDSSALENLLLMRPRIKDAHSSILYNSKNLEDTQMLMVK